MKVAHGNEYYDVNGKLVKKDPLQELNEKKENIVKRFKKLVSDGIAKVCDEIHNPSEYIK